MHALRTLNKQTILLFVISFLPLFVISQSTIDIAESTLKVGPLAEETFYYGFAEGDQMIFNFEEINGKELKEIEIMFMPSKSIFMDYKTKKISNKTLTISETGIYKFRFTNSNILAGRICKFKIQRIPANESSSKFNTTVYKRTVFDTTYTMSQAPVLIRSDTLVSEILSENVKVHSTTNVNSNRTCTNFSLPRNTISWSYYIGVDQAGQQVYENASKEVVSKSSPLITSLVGSNPLGALAMGLTSYLTQLHTSSGEAINFYLIDSKDANAFQQKNQFGYYKQGKAVNSFAKYEPMPGNLSFCFINDNTFTGVSVLLKITAVQVNQIYETKEIKRENITSQEELYLKNK